MNRKITVKESLIVLGGINLIPELIVELERPYEKTINFANSLIFIGNFFLTGPEGSSRFCLISTLFSITLSLVFLR